MNSLKRVIIFGATSAIAEHAARQLVAKGAAVYCIGRNPAKLDALVSDLKVRSGGKRAVYGRVADLVQWNQHSQLVEEAAEALGGIDAALIAQGTLPNQKACEGDVQRTLEEIEVNALSVISLLSIVANKLEVQGHGVITVISSVAGDRGRQSNYVYGSAKGMVTLFSQGLRNRLAKSNVDVVTIKPGFVDTPMTAAFEKNGPLWAKPENIAQSIVVAMQKGKNEVYTPWFWWVIMKVIKIVPESIFKRMSL